MNTDGHGLKHGDLTDRILKAFYEVYGELGYGFLESVYESSMHLVLTGAGIQVERQRPITVRFRGQVVGEYAADLLVERLVIVELKAARTLDPAHEAQVLNYLRATPIEVGLLLNFGPQPQIKRFTFDNARKSPARPGL